MFTSRSRFIVCFGVLVLLCQTSVVQAQAPAKKGPDEAYKKLLQKAEDEYRILFKKPETVPEFWAGINFEIDVGKFDVAALLLKQLLEKQPAAETDKELVRIEEAKGLSTFLRLRRVQQWSENPLIEQDAEKNVDLLINRVTAALDKYLGDPERLGKFIKALDAPLVEERAYAFLQLNRAGDRASPFLAEALRTSAGTPLNRRIQNALVRLNAEVVTPLYAMLIARDAKDAGDIDLRVALLNVIKERGDRRALPELWQLTSLPKYPAMVRDRAGDTLGYLLQMPRARLPAAREALVEVAEKYAHHQARYEAPRLSLEDRKAFEANFKGKTPAAVWNWGEKGLVRTLMPGPAADLYHGLRYAREALQVSSAYRPAQALFVALSIEQGYDQRLDEVFTKKAPPALQRLLAEIDGDLIEEVLERALGDGNLPVILGAVQALGERGEARLARQAAGPQPQGLVRALYYPDRRVQFAAVQALQRMPGNPAPATAARQVEVLRRFVAADPVRKLVLLYVPEGQKAEVRKSVQGAGFEPAFVADLKDAFAVLHQATNIDFVLINYTAPQAELPYLLTQLRADADVGLLPVLLITPPERMGPGDKNRDVLLRQQFQENLGVLAAQHRNVWLIPEAAVLAPQALKEQLRQFSRYATLPRGERSLTGEASLRLDRLSADVKAEFSPAEQKLCTMEALRLLLQMARSDGDYELRPALPAAFHALLTEDTAPQAIELLGRLPGAEAQQRLAGVVLDAKRAKLRVPAAIELSRNVQRYGQLLTRTMTPDQLRQFRALAENPAEDPVLRAQVAVVIGSMGSSPQQTGSRLNRFVPDVAAPRK